MSQNLTPSTEFGRFRTILPNFILVRFETTELYRLFEQDRPNKRKKKKKKNNNNNNNNNKTTTTAIATTSTTTVMPSFHYSAAVLPLPFHRCRSSVP